jgi:hypothetical protein
VNDGSDFNKVKDYIFDGFDKADQSWPDLVRRAKENELRYIEKDGIRLNEPPSSPCDFYTDTDSDAKIDTDTDADTDTDEEAWVEVQELS